MSDALPLVVDILKKAFVLLVIAIATSCGLGVWIGSMLIDLAR